MEALNTRRLRRRVRAAALTGSLAHFGLPTLLTVLDLEHRTGLLDLRCCERAARLSLRGGQVVQAEIRGEPVRGAEAVYAALGWVDGGFIFRVGEVTDDDEVSLPTSVLLLEAARRADELAA